MRFRSADKSKGIKSHRDRIRYELRPISVHFRPPSVKVNSDGHLEGNVSSSEALCEVIGIAFILE
jgi:hypothetical protein